MSSLSLSKGAHAPGRFGTRWARLNGPDRIAGVDLARGLAVLGMFAAHLLTTADAWVWTDPSTWSAIVDGRSSILFATLAGVSIGLVTGAHSPHGGSRMGVARGRLAARAGMLWVLGILLILTGVPVYVILPAYGILFLLALPFTTWDARSLLWAAVGWGSVMALAQPALNELPIWSGEYGEEISAALGWNYPFTLWIAFVLAGMGLARADITRRRTQVRMTAAGTALAAVGYTLAEVPLPTDSLYLQIVWQATPHSSGLWELVGSGGFAVGVIGVCLLLCRARPIRMLTLPLRATGSMPLSAYTAQLVVWALVALALLGDTGDLLGFRALDLFWPLTLGTIAGCTLWALAIGRGPLEWVLDRVARLVGRL